MSRTPEQQRVIEWLRDDLELPVFAGAYEGALHFLEEKPAGYITFVAHACRDLMNRLASTVEGIESSRVQYPQLVDNLKRSWRDEWRGHILSETETTIEGHIIPFKVCWQVSNLIDQHTKGNLRSSEADLLFFNTFLEYPERDRIPKNFMRDWTQAKKWFVAHAHIRKSNYSCETDTALRSHFSNLHSFLYVAASTQYERLQYLNEILESTNQ